MAEPFPFLLVLETVLAANGTGTLSYSIPTQEEMEILGWRQQSTGTFGIIDIRTADGRHYTNASPTTEIPSEFVADVADNNHGMVDFPVPIKIRGGGIVYFEVEDSSGEGNTITMLLHCRRWSAP